MFTDSQPEVTLICSLPSCGARRRASAGQTSGVRCVECGSEMRVEEKEEEEPSGIVAAEKGIGDIPRQDPSFPLSLEVCFPHYLVAGCTTTFKCRVTNHSREAVRGVEVVFRCSTFEDTEKVEKIRRTLQPGRSREKKIEVQPLGAGQRVLHCILRSPTPLGVRQVEGEREVTVLERPESIRDLRIEFGHNAFLGNEGKIDFGQFRSVNDFIQCEFDKPFEAVDLEEFEPPTPEEISEDFTNGLGMEFRRIPAGGKAVWFARNPVTQGFWERVMGETLRDCFSRAEGPGRELVGLGESFPVYYVSHEEAETFCRRLNSMEKEARHLPAGYCYRLPTVFEWTCAAGVSLENDAELDQTAWHGGISGGVTHPVGELAANHHGLYDLRGNVFEWCQTTLNQEGADEAPVRGGSWYGSDLDRKCCRDGGDLNVKRSVRSSRIGFRVVLALCERG